MRNFDDIAVNILHIDAAALSDSLTPQDVPDWDSMNYLLFIAELEKEYGISFTMDEVMNAQTLGDIRKIVDARKK